VAQSTLAPAPDMRRYGLREIEAVFDRPAILGAVEQAFLDEEAGRCMSVRPTHLSFPDGDCHIKCGYMVAGESITIKIATGFYTNESRGLPNGSGLVLVLDQHTGLPRALLDDAGWLTAWRTVAATVIAVKVGRMAPPLRVGIVGGGLQAELAARWLAATIAPASQQIWARSPEKAQKLALKVGGGTRAERDLATLCLTSNVIVTATPSRIPLIKSDWVCPGTHVVALGADNPGKVEIDPALFSRATAIMTDNHSQCLDHGDFGAAVRAGAVAENADISLGRVLREGEAAQRHAQAITIVDLTGLAAQDDAIARLFLQRLAGAEAVQ
jgi:ornithine cyclodeaminase